MLDPLHRWLEGRTLRSASALVTVNHGWGARFGALYPQLTTIVIPNGHDGVSLVDEPRRTSGRLQVLYVGKLDPAEQELGVFLEGFSAWLRHSTGDVPQVDVTFHTYGEDAAGVERLLRGQCNVRCRRSVDHAQSLTLQREADVLLVFCWKRDPNWLPAKLFEYVGARRSILAIGSGDTEVARLVESAGAGTWAATPAQVEDVMHTWYRAWSSGEPLPAPSVEAAAAHDFRHRVTEYDDLLRSVVLDSPAARAQ